jgi:chromosomal replication initiation ATPase DnaA
VTTDPPALTNKLRRQLPRAAALAIAARNHRTKIGKASVTDVLATLDIAQLRDLATCLALFADITTLVSESLEDPMEPIELAVRAAARRFGVTEEMMLAPGRGDAVTDARHVAMYLAHKLFAVSSVRVGKMLARDHSTVLYGCRRVEDNPRLRNIAVDIATRVGQIEDEAS